MHFDATSDVLTVSGDLDEAPTATLRSALEERRQDHPDSLVLDLTGVTYLSSAAVGVLAKARQEFETSGADLELAARSGSVAERVLTVCAMPHRSY
jgi:anti-anti-sigma factor